MKDNLIKTLSVLEAQELQFKLVDAITSEFEGSEFINLGDLGVVQPMNQPIKTLKIERVLAEFFGTESATLVRGSGTGALRYSLFSMLKDKQCIFVHDAPIYPTTKTTLDMWGKEVVYVDYNDLQGLELVLKETVDEVFLVQYTRQKPDDYYDYEQVVSLIEKYGNVVVSDDNYAAMKVNKLAASICPGVSTFSSFKLQGPEGVGVIVGQESIISDIKTMNYSGGSQVQGYEALEVLRGLVIAPVMLAIQSDVVDKTIEKLESNEFSFIENAFATNAQSKVIIVKLKEPVAKEVLLHAQKLGAAPNPIGAESKYEVVPMFYKVSGTFLKNDPSMIDYMIRINPMRSGPDTIIKILKEAYNNVSR